MALNSWSNFIAFWQSVMIVVAIVMFVGATVVPATGLVVTVAEHAHTVNVSNDHTHVRPAAYQNACDDITGVHCGSKLASAPTVVRPIGFSFHLLYFAFEMQRLAAFNAVGDPPPPRL